MNFEPTPIADVYLVQPERFEDERGSFSRTFIAQDFADRGLEVRVVESAVSYNHKRGTLRGMHYQTAPHEQTKLVRCTRGAIYDVIVDLRPGSTSIGQWFGVELSAANNLILFVPGGCAHGFVTIEDGSEVCYQMSGPYHPPAERGVRWDDPRIGVCWPVMPTVISARDRQFPDWKPGA